MHSIFHFAELPPVAVQAIAITGYAVDQYVSMADRLGFKLLVVAHPGLTSIRRQNAADGRRRLKRGMVERVKMLAEERGLPFFDLLPKFVSQGPLSETRFRYDGHWNEEGHRRAANGIFEFLVENPELLR